MRRLESKDAIALAIHAGRLAASALELQTMTDIQLVRLQLRDVAEWFDKTLKYVQAVEQAPEPPK